MAGSLHITAATADPALLDLPWDLPLEEWPDEHIAALPRGISRHLVRFVEPLGLRHRHQGDRPPRWRSASTTCSAPLQRLDVPVRRARRRHHRAAPTTDGERARRRAGHPAPAVLAALPRAVLPDAAARHGDPPRRRPGRAARPAAPRRLLLGRRVAVEHAVPARRRRVRRVPRRRRDRASCYERPLQRAARERPRDRPHQHRRRADGPGGRRPRRRGRSTRSRSPNGIVAAYRSLWNELTEPRVVLVVASAGGSANASSVSTTSASTSRSSRSRPPTSGTTVRIQPKVVDAGHHSRRLLRLTGLDVEENQARRLLNDLDSYRATARQAGARRGDRRPRLARRASSSRSSAPSRATCAASSSRPRSSTRCSSTAGSCRRTRDATCRWRRR